MFNKKRPSVEKQERLLKHLQREQLRERLANQSLTHEELVRALAFLQSSSVIDSNQYTQLYTKALPFTKG